MVAGEAFLLGKGKQHGCAGVARRMLRVSVAGNAFVFGYILFSHSIEVFAAFLCGSDQTHDVASEFFAGTTVDIAKHHDACSDRALNRHASSLNEARHSGGRRNAVRSEEHTSELQSLMRISYAVFCLK